MSNLKTLSFQGAVVALSLIAFTVSLFLPGVISAEGVTKGYVLLLVGGLGIFQGIFCWLANPLYVVTLLCLQNKNNAGAFLSSVTALLLALLALHYEGSYVSYFDSTGPFGTLGTGFYVWVGAIAILLVVSLVNVWTSKNISEVS